MGVPVRRGAGSAGPRSLFVWEGERGRIEYGRQSAERQAVDKSDARPEAARGQGGRR
jgi:hypothetical protein